MLAVRKHNNGGDSILKTAFFSRRSSLGAIALTALSLNMLALAGCAAFQPDPQAAAEQKESLLSAAGFRMLPAETPEKLAHVQSLPPLKVKYFTDPDGTLHYWMADAQYCHCVYVGNEAAYQKYKQMQFQAQLAAEESRAAEMRAEAAQEEQMELMNPMLMTPMWVY